MNAVYISVILPEVRDESKLRRFCSSLFAASVNTELCICGRISEDTALSLGRDYGEKIKLFPPQTVNRAIEKALGTYILFSDEAVTFADDALETLIVRGQGNACICNAAYVENGNSVKLMSAGFRLSDAACESVFTNYLFKNKIISQYSLRLTGDDSLAVRIFAADYMRYERFILIDEVLMYTDSRENTAELNAETLGEYAAVFSGTDDDTAAMFFLKAVFTSACENMSAAVFAALKAVTEKFADRPVVLAWLEAQIGVDTDVLLNGDFSQFRCTGNELHYKEICLPMNKNDVIMNFYSGKFGIDVLKKCIGAWLYYKIYRGKNGAVKKIGCKLCRRLLGGEFDV